MNPADLHRISPAHLQRAAIVYVRQSDPQQVREHTESTQLQRGLRERAVDFGWPTPTVVEDDLGITASGFAERPGFQRLLAQVTMRQVGIILCIEASRLSRNSTDWAHLFELCGYFDTLVADLQQIYDVSLPNDRLVLQIKGTVAELELSNMKTRLRSGLEAKAARGELKVLLPSGYVYDADEKMVVDPDQRIQQSVRLMFERFEQATSVRQLAISYRDSSTVFPIKKKNRTVWEIPKLALLHQLLTHPIFAGVYARGRSESFVDCVDGKLVKRTRRILCPEEWKVCIKEHHESYISWKQYQSNQAKLAEARPRWRMDDNRGAVREGKALLAGLLRCGHCGRKLRVLYNRKSSAQYFCDGSGPRGTQRCLAFGAKYVDDKVGEQLCWVVEPSAVEASQEAFALHQQKREETVKQARLRVQAAQYAADRAFEQYDLADPKNRLVVDTLEKRLNEKLAETRVAQQHLEDCLKLHPPLSKKQRRQLESLASDFPSLWAHPGTPTTLRKNLLRTALREVVVTHDVDKQQLDFVMHWDGDCCSQVMVKKRVTPIGSRADGDLVELVNRLSQEALGDGEIARILNMKELTTPRGLRWTMDRVEAFRAHHGIRKTKHVSGDNVLTGQQAREYLGVGYNGLVALIRRGLIHTNQVTDFAPWRIPRNELDAKEVRDLAAILKRKGRLPADGGSPQSQSSLFPEKSRSL